MAVDNSNTTWLRAIRSSLAQNPILQKIYYSRVKRPSLPNGVGMSMYQARSSWALDPDACPCDLELVDYLKQNNIQDKSIFHFGTGEHHIVGLENQGFDRPNEILGITASAPEHDSYVQLVLKDTSLAKYYKVLFADIYTLTANSLPAIDIAVLFHLCEFYMPENAHLVHQTDESLLQLFLDKLNPDGKVLFYTRSQKWMLAEPIVQAFEAAGKIKKIDEYKNLLIYAKG